VIVNQPPIWYFSLDLMDAFGSLFPSGIAGFSRISAAKTPLDSSGFSRRCAGPARFAARRTARGEEAIEPIAQSTYPLIRLQTRINDEGE
jgi:hypothetical protein